MATIAEQIRRKRLQILVHSYFYYERNINLISDFQFDSFEKELLELQNTYPEIAKTVEYADAFEKWEGSTGAFLPYKDSRIVRIAERLLSGNAQIKPPDIPKKQKTPTIKQNRLF